MIFPPPQNTSIQNTIKGYIYEEYNDDDNVVALMDGYNAYSQAYLDYMNGLELPIYTNGTIVGTLLDWVANGLYGFPRPGLPSPGYPAIGPYNTAIYNTISYNGYTPPVNSTFTLTTDDIYKRCLTWLFYKGDGHQFNIKWLKRRVARFLFGENGTDFNIDQTYGISVAFTGPYAATITTPTSPVAIIFAAAVAAGVLELPFQIVWSVVLT